MELNTYGGLGLALLVAGVVAVAVVAVGVLGVAIDRVAASHDEPEGR